MTPLRPSAAMVWLRFWPLHLLGWSGFVLVSFCGALAHGKPPGYMRVTLITAATGMVVTYCLRRLMRALWPLHGAQLWALLPVVLMCALVIGIANAFALIEWCGEEGRPESLIGYLAYGGGFVYVVMAYAGLYVAIKNQLALQLQNELTLRAQAIAHEAQLKMLRYQLNPHFLFNTLNAISTLIVAKENLQAERMLGRLASFLRHSLDAEPTQRVTLQQELDALALYLDIEKARFAERLHVIENIDLQARIALVPSLLLQPLVENAIKYAVSKRVEGGTITIEAQCRDGQLILRVSDDGPGFGVLRDGLPHGMGVGLSNSRERLEVLYSHAAHFELENRQPRGASICMVLPFEVDAQRARSPAGADFDARLSAAMGAMGAMR